jgi:hypothetical protein
MSDAVTEMQTRSRYVIDASSIVMPSTLCRTRVGSRGAGEWA